MGHFSILFLFWAATQFLFKKIIFILVFIFSVFTNHVDGGMVADGVLHERRYYQIQSKVIFLRVGRCIRMLIIDGHRKKPWHRATILTSYCRRERIYLILTLAGGSDSR